MLGQRYELEEQVGAGGFSEVWRARDLTLNRLVAVKLLHDGYAHDAEALARFRAEARHAGGLAHENIARVYDYGETDQPYLVMELVEGPSLSSVLAGGPVDPGRTMDLVAQAAAGLQVAHAGGLVHRDVKPANLMLAPGGIVKVTDFGISQAVGSAPVTSTGQVVGTAGYLAPERAGGASATPASDLYSLGVVAYECLTGTLPFTGTPLEVALAHANRPFPALPEWVPRDVAALVAQLTAKDPANRPASAGDVARRARQLSDRLALGSSSAVTRHERVSALRGEPGAPGRLAIPGPRWTSNRLGQGLAVLGTSAVLVALVVAVVGEHSRGPRSAGHPVAKPSLAVATPSLTTGAPKHRTVMTADVNAGSLVGQPVSVAVRELRQQKMVPRILWQHTVEQQPGRVTAIEPAGQQPVGSIITLVGALAIPASEAASPPQASKPASTGPGTSNSEHNGKSRGKGKGNGRGKGKGNG